MRLRDFARDDRGVMTFWILTWSFLFIAFAGLAVDVSNAYRMRATLQATADSAAHAGVVALVETDDVDSAKSAAITFSQLNLDPASNGQVVELDDVAVGAWDEDARSFTEGGADLNAVWVRASRSDISANKTPLPTSLLRVIDYNSWNITVASVAQGAVAECLQTNNLTAYGTVSFTSNTTFGGDLCVHGYTGVVGSQNHTVQDGSNFRITMENARDAVSNTPSPETGGWDVTGTDLDGWYDAAHLIPWSAETAAVLKKIDDEIAHFEGSRNEAGEVIQVGECAAGTVRCKIVSNGGGQNSYSNQLVADIEAGYQYFHVTCDLGQGNNVFNIPVEAVLHDVTIITDCEIKTSTGSGIDLQNATIMTTATTTNPGQGRSAINLVAKPVSAPHTATCGYAPGATLVAIGDVSFTSNANFGDIEILSASDVSWTANANFTNSVQINSWGNISMTANGVVTPCYSEGNGTIAESRTIKIVN